MPALSYKARFVELIADGRKPHSIRAWRRRPFKAGDVLMHYTAMRTKQCRKIRPDTLCLAASPIEVNAKRGYVVLHGEPRCYFAGRMVPHVLERLAVCDGFACVDDFFAFFIESAGGLLCGQLVEWDPFSLLPGDRTAGVQAVCTPQVRALGAGARAPAATAGSPAAK